MNTTENVLGWHSFLTWECAMLQRSCVKVHQKGCGGMGFMDHTTNDALANVELTETSVTTTPKNVDHALCGDSNQEGCMIVSSDLLGPLVAIDRGN